MSVILMDIIPGKGPTGGGPRIALIGANFPSSTIFARFGNNVVKTV